LSAKFLVYETLNLGVNYRWDDAISTILGFNIIQKFNVDYVFDYSANNLNNSETHEVFLRYQSIRKEKQLKSPRFF